MTYPKIDLKTSFSTQDVHGIGQTLNLNVLSGFALSFAGKSIRIPNRKARALISYLALTPGHCASREQLVGLLWSEKSEDHARASLRQTVRGLRRAFEACSFTGLTIERNDLTLETAQVDVDQIAKDLESGEINTLLLERERVTDTLLLGFDDLDPAFRNWLRVQRESIAQKFIRKLGAMLQAPEQTPDKTGRTTAEAISQIDPTNEVACRHLIRDSATNGDTASALKIYNRLWNLLERDYDSEPSQQTLDLIADVKLGMLQGPSSLPIIQLGAGGTGNPMPPNRSRLLLRVINFDRTNIDKHHYHICTGFQSEMVAMLVRFREWKVIDGDTNHAENDTDTVNYELGGRFVQETDQIYFVCQLRDFGSGTVIWSDSFQFDLKRYFRAQENIVRKVTYSLNVHISHERLRKYSGVPDVSLETYDRWLRGQTYFLQWNPDTRIRATNIFKSIINDAPNFSRAFSSMVSLLNSDHFVFPGVYRSQDNARQSLEFARKAVDLDPLDSRSQLHLGWAQAMGGDFDIAQLSFGLACELNEHDPWTAASVAGGFAFSGLPELGLEWSEKALELAIAPSPMVWAYTSVVRFINDDIEGCLLAASQADADVVIMNAWRVAALWKLGRQDEARSQCARFFERVRGTWYGAGPPTSDAIVDWAITCFPIRSEQVIEDFRQYLSAPAQQI